MLRYSQWELRELQAQLEEQICSSILVDKDVLWVVDFGHELFSWEEADVFSEKVYGHLISVTIENMKQILEDEVSWEMVQSSSRYMMAVMRCLT